MIKILSILLVTCGLSYGQTPIASSYREFSGGLNNFNASVSIAPNESPNLLNVVIDEPLGALSQRKGYTACGTIPSGATATALYEYSKNDGSRRLIVSDNNTIWQTGDCINYSTIATNLGSLNLPRFATVQDNLWIVNGSTYPIIWNGSTGYYLDGASNRPLGPKGKLITYWKSRVWIGNTATSPSGLYFSALVDANDAILDPAVSTMAWANALNLIYFNRDNGSPLYGIKVYRDNLYAFKENDILRLVFESEYTASGITVTKTVSKTGSKFQESIVEMDDGLLRFVGRDGVYAFDGSIVKRISTKWTPTFYTIKQPTHGEQYALWDSAADWSNGTLVNISTSQAVGSLELRWVDFQDSVLSANPKWTTLPGYSACSIGCLSPGCAFNPARFMLCNSQTNTMMWSTSTLVTGDFIFDMAIAPSGGNNADFTFISTSTTKFTGYRVQAYGAVVGIYYGTGFSTVCSYSGSFSGWHTFKVNRASGGIFTLYMDGAQVCSGTNNTVTSSGYMVNGGYVDNIQWIFPTTSGDFTSQISTATGLTLWKTFDVDQAAPANTSISYQVRVASTIYNLGLASYNTIVPGSIVSASTNTFYQWKANLATTDNGVTPILNSASVGWVTGDSSKSPLTALAYKSRYWLAASTGLTNQYNDLTMVESKSPLMTYTKYDLPLSAMTLWNDNLYGAIGNTSKIVRVDYGDTDDGTAITSYWDSRDDVYDNPVVYKSINRQIADFSATPANANLQIGLSSDFGANWQYRTVNTGVDLTLIRNTSVLNLDANNALQFRSRVFNNTSGVGYTIYGLHGMGTATDFIGNQ